MELCENGQLEASVHYPRTRFQCSPDVVEGQGNGNDQGANATWIAQQLAYLEQPHGLGPAQ